MTLPTPTTTAEIYLAAIHKELGEILQLAMRPVDLESLARQVSERIGEKLANRPQAVELKEPKRKAK